MKFVKDFIDGLRSYTSVFQLANQLKLWNYIFISGLISLAIGSILLWIGYSFYGDFGVWISSFYPWERGASLVQGLSKFVSSLAVLGVGLILYKYAIIILLSPLMSVLSEKVEKHFKGDIKSQTLIEAGISIVRGIRISGRNLFRELSLVLVLLILSFVPLLNVITTPLIFLVQAYYAGYGNMDYTMERHFKLKETVPFVRRHRGLAIGNGAVFLAILFIPILGLLFAPALATCSSAIEVIKRIEA